MEDQRIKEVELVIAKFNAVKERHFGLKSNEHKYERYMGLFDSIGFREIARAIDSYPGDDIYDFFESLDGGQPDVVEEIPEDEEVGTDGLAMLEKAIASTISKSILGKVESKIDRFIEKNYGPLPKLVEVVANNKSREMKGLFHEKFEEVLNFVNAEIPVFLAGPAGSGKNVICQQVAEALGLGFYFSNAVTQEYKLTGFTDANGVFHESQFYKAFKDGGLFFLDEMDASVPEVLIILNAAIANGYFDFPAPIGKVDAHDDFRVISAGNTFGLGASIEYTGRNQLDGASLDRFAVIEIDYDMNIEMAVCGNDRELVDFIHDYRKACQTSGIQSIASYRAIERIAKMDKVLGLEEALRTCLVKNLRKDDLSVMLSEIPAGTRYRSALKKLAS
jgi:hypothetical protein